MTCARRPAGARIPAPATSAVSRRPDLRFRRACARVSRLPALALLLGAFGLFAAAPAAAQDPTPPSAPQNVAVVAGDKSATLTWDPPASWGDGHSRVYFLETKLSSAQSPTAWRAAGFDGGDSTQPPTVTSYTFSGTQGRQNLTYVNGTSYDFRINAVTLKPGTDGTSNSDLLLSADVVVTATPRAATDAPGALAGLAATPGDGRVHLSWTPPSGDVSGYDIHRTSSTAVADEAAGNLTNNVATAWKSVYQASGGHRVTPYATLVHSNGTAYRIRVRAVNSAGNGPWAFVGATPAATTVPTAQWARASVTVTEADGDRFLNLRIFLSEPLTGAATLTISQADASAMGAAGSADWSKVAGHCAEGASGDESMYCAVTIKGDNVTESDETLKLTMSAGTGSIAVGTRSTITVTIKDGNIAPGARLSGLAASSGTSAAGPFTPLDIGRFAPVFRSYAATVGNSVTHVKFTPTVAVSGATVRVGKGASLTTVASGTASGAIALDVGANAIVVEVTAVDGTTTATYTVVVTRRQRGAVTGLAVNPGGGGLDLHVSWTAPSETPTGYDVHYTSSNQVDDEDAASGSDPSAAWVAVARGMEASPPATSQTIGSLTSGTAYRVRVRAKYADGDGSWVFAARTASANPSLTDLQVENGDRLLVLSWTAPTAGTVLVYNMHYTSSATVSRSAERGTDPATAWVSAIGTSSATSYTLTGLTNGVRYRVRVITVTDDGSGGSTGSPWVYGAGTPATPVINFEEAGTTINEGSAVNPTLTKAPVLAASSNINVLVDAASTAGSDDYTGYTAGTPTAIAMFADEKVFTYTSARLGLTDDAVNEPRETVILRLQAITNAPYTLGTQTTHTVTITDNDPPAAPGGLSLSAGNQQLTASWTRPVGPVAGYELRHKHATAADQAATTPGDPSTGWVTTTPSGTPTSATIAGLSNGTAHHVQVRATDGQTETGNGWGDWSSSQTGTPMDLGPNAVPGRPSGLAVAPGNGELVLAWTAPAGTVTGYDVHYTSAASGTAADGAAASGSDPSAAWVAVDRTGTGATQRIPPLGQSRLARLSNDTVHRVRVRAVNANGAGAWAHGTGTPTDKAVTLLADPPRVREGSVVVMTARLQSPAPAGGVSIPVAVTTTAPDTAETADVGALTAIAVAEGEHEGSARLSTAQDDDADDETFTVSLGSTLPAPWVAGSPSSVTVAIADDEAPPVNMRLSPGDASLVLTWDWPQCPPVLAEQTQPGTMVDCYDVQKVEARWRVKDADSGMAGDQPGAWAPQGTNPISGVTTSWVTLSLVQVRARRAVLPPECGHGCAPFANGTAYEVQIRVVKSTADGGQTVGWVSAGEGTPEADARPTVWLSASPNPVAEGSPVTVTATLSASLAQSATIPVTVTAVTAESGDHGTLASIAINAGATSGTGTVATARDADLEDETFTVELGTLPSAVRAGSPSSVEVAITDDGLPSVSLSASPNPVAEGSAVTVTATLSASLPQATTIPLTLTAGTAESADYGTLASIAVAANATSGTGQIATNEDADTSDETFTVAFGTLPSTVAAGVPSSVEITIADNDTPPPPPPGGGTPPPPPPGGGGTPPPPPPAAAAAAAVAAAAEVAAAVAPAATTWIRS